jgi:hypothetical protein
MEPVEGMIGMRIYLELNSREHRIGFQIVHVLRALFNRAADGAIDPFRGNVYAATDAQFLAICKMRGGEHLRIFDTGVVVKSYDLVGLHG